MTKPKQSTTPLFPDFHLLTLRRKPRSAQQILKQQQNESERKSFTHLHHLLKDFLPKNLFGTSSGRKRLFTKKNTFFTFLHQCWSEDGSCQEAVHRLREQADAQGMKKLPSASTSAYVQARHRLDLEELRDVFYHGAGTIEMNGEALHDERPWVVVDGTGLSMPDTEENQEVWPQPSNQKPGLGFPNVKVVASLSLHTGAVLDAEFGNKHENEIILFRRLSDSFQKDDIVIGDRGFDSWHDTISLLQRGVDTVFRRNARRTILKTSEAKKVLGKGDLLIASKRPAQRPPHISLADWKTLPEELLLRQITFTVDRPGFRPSVITVVTTLLDPVDYPTEKIKTMYLRRWQIEVSFRDLKTTMGIDILRCKTPDMIRKEIWMNLIAYNALCYLQVQTAIQKSVERFRLSFKGCMEVLRTWESRFRQLTSSTRIIKQKVFDHMAAILLPIRPDRVEPRVKKRRPKKVRLMTKPRHILRQEMMKGATC
jgi:hypothetical protein